ncbi:hypothetical protein [Aurantivibrio infirmus]
MSMSVYYKFELSQEIEEEFREHYRSEWDNEFNGKPYESWYWDEPKIENNKYSYEGAVKMPPKMDAAWEAIQVAVALLTLVRRRYGGSNWQVSLDDHEFQWIESEEAFDPTQ